MARWQSGASFGRHHRGLAPVPHPSQAAAESACPPRPAPCPSPTPLHICRLHPSSAAAHLLLAPLLTQGGLGVKVGLLGVRLLLRWQLGQSLRQPKRERVCTLRATPPGHSGRPAGHLPPPAVARLVPRRGSRAQPASGAAGNAPSEANGPPAASLTAQPASPPQPTSQTSQPTGPTLLRCWYLWNSTRPSHSPSSTLTISSSRRGPTCAGTRVSQRQGGFSSWAWQQQALGGLSGPPSRIAGCNGRLAGCAGGCSHTEASCRQVDWASQLRRVGKTGQAPRHGGAPRRGERATGVRLGAPPPPPAAPHEIAPPPPPRSPAVDK